MTRVMLAAGVTVVLGVALTGCSPTTEHPSTVAATPPTIWTGSPAPKGYDAHGGGGSEGGHSDEAQRAEGANLHQYIVDNDIAEIPFKKDEPGTPKIDFPFPPDWSPAGARTPDWAYGAIVYDKAPDPTNPAFIYAIANKLTGNVDPQKILDLAPGQLNELPEFKPREAPWRDKVGGYDAISYVGNYVWEGERRAVGQQTIVIPGKDTVFVLQLNAEAPKGQEDAVVDAVKLIQQQTKITLPS